jgi:hypothetical protein
LDFEEMRMPLTLESPSGNGSPTNDTEVKLQELYDKYLPGNDVDSSTNFFASGGCDSSAQEMLKEINSVFELDISLDDLKKYPVISELSKLTKRKQSKLNRSVIPLNTARGKPPIFFICGIALYSNLAKKLSSQFSCYGIYIPEETEFLNRQGEGTDVSIRILAQLYVEAIVKHASQGPYTIAGVSFGGVLAYEIAYQLEMAGYQVNGLIILDAVLPGAIKSSLQYKIRKMILKFKQAWTKKTQNEKASPERAIDKKQKDLWQIIRSRAIQNYLNEPITFNGTTLIVRAKDQDGCEVELDLCWGPKLSGPIVLGESNGNHLEILQQDTTANLILQFLTPRDIMVGSQRLINSLAN